jgi:hypothetical protein
VNYFLSSTLLLFVSLPSFASSVRTTTMSEDILINQTLYNALKESVTKVDGVKATADGFALVFNNESLSCNPSGCNLSWDANAIQDSAHFQTALYQTLSNWAEAGGQQDSAFRRFTYPTGNIQITIDESYDNQDQVQCTMLNANNPYITCSLVVSERTTTAKTDGVYDSLLNNSSSLISAEMKTMAHLFQGKQFAAATNPQYGNRLTTVEHTVYTDLLMDGYVASTNYAYVTPVTEDGIVVSDGMTMTLTGSEDGEGTFRTDTVQVESYAQAQPMSNAAVANKAMSNATPPRNQALHAKALEMIHTNAAKAKSIHL